MEPRTQGVGQQQQPVDPFVLVSKAREDLYTSARAAGKEPSPWIEECLGEFEHIQRAALGSRMPVTAESLSGATQQ